MNVSDEELMAFVDGELDAERSERIRCEAESNADLARRIAAQEELRHRLRSAFEPTLQEEVPGRLRRALDRPDATHERLTVRRRRTSRNTWLGGLALAAGVVLGTALGPALFAIRGSGADIVSRGGQLTASGALERVLTNEVAVEIGGTDRVRLGVTFQARSGEYCRTFVTVRGDRDLAGLACRDDDAWRIDALQTVSPATGQADSYRQALSAIPPVVLAAAQEAMAGEAFDESAEAEARDRGWTVAKERAGQ